MAHPRRSMHDKTSYSILPTPPSPTRIISPSPSLSPSNSNSAGSSTEPATPPSRPRGRTRNLYPDSIGRVPLHRRGTSKTYERLEDLLREAGYKETRIFTPESERTAPQDETKSPTIGSSFVGFLSNLVPSRSASLKREEEPEAFPPVYSPPTSPLQSRTPRPSVPHATRNSVSQQQYSRCSSNATVIIHRTDNSSQQQPRRSDASGTRPPRPRTADMQQRHRIDSIVAPLPADLPLHQPVPSRPTNRYYQHHPSSSRGSGVVSPPPLPPVHHPTPTRASSYLRHMTSHDRAQSTPPTYTRVTDDAEEESLLSPSLPPRMPTNWMDNVKRAREYFAVPPPPLSAISASPAPTVKLNRSVSAKTRGRLSDRTNAHAPPLLTARLTTARASRSESQVSASRVVCRSRGSSPVRRDKGKAREADLDLRGQLELPDPEDIRARFLGGWGTASAGAQLLSPPRRGVSCDTESEASSDGEDEITLARILVPSRHERPTALERSRSVRSLRRCLELDVGQGDVPPVPPLPLALQGSGRWSVSLSWGRARGETQHRDDGDPEVYVTASGRSSQRQRNGLPAWAT